MISRGIEIKVVVSFLGLTVTTIIESVNPTRLRFVPNPPSVPISVPKTKKDTGFLS